MDIFNIVLLSFNIIGASISKNWHSLLGWGLSLALYIIFIIQKGI